MMSLQVYCELTTNINSDFVLVRFIYYCFFLDNLICGGLDPLTQIAKEQSYFNSLGGGHLKCISDALELFRASQLIISPDDSALRKKNLQTSHFLKQTLSDGLACSDTLSRYIGQEVVSVERCLIIEPFKVIIIFAFYFS